MVSTSPGSGETGWQKSGSPITLTGARPQNRSEIALLCETTDFVAKADKSSSDCEDYTCDHDVLSWLGPLKMKLLIRGIT